MRDDDQIQRDSAERLQIGRRNAPDAFWIQAAIDQNIQIAELDEQRVGTDAAIAVQVS